MPQNHLGHLGGKFGCYFQLLSLLNKFVQVDLYITPKLTRRMVRAFDSVCAFDACHALILLVVHLIVCALLILVMLW